MLYFYRFAAGVITGALAVTLLRNKKAQDTLRGAVASGAEAIRKGSAQAKARFAEKASAAPAAEAPEATVAEEPAPKAAPPRRRRPAANRAQSQNNSGKEE